jgi:amino acid permease
LFFIIEQVNKSLDVSLDTSEDVARHVAGRYGYIATIAAICVTQIGIGCAYVLFVANQLYSVQATLNVQEWALCVSPVFVALCWIRNIRALAPVSAFGLIAVGLAVSVVIYEVDLGFRLLVCLFV